MYFKITPFTCTSLLLFRLSLNFYMKHTPNEIAPLYQILCSSWIPVKKKQKISWDDRSHDPRLTHKRSHLSWRSEKQRHTYYGTLHSLNFKEPASWFQQLILQVYIDRGWTHHHIILIVLDWYIIIFIFFNKFLLWKRSLTKH